MLAPLRANGSSICAYRKQSGRIPPKYRVLTFSVPTPTREALAAQKNNARMQRPRIGRGSGRNPNTTSQRDSCSFTVAGRSVPDPDQASTRIILEANRRSRYLPDELAEILDQGRFRQILQRPPRGQWTA